VRPEPEEPLPVTLLTGFLGAGKTTLVNRILTERGEGRFAVVVNEFGDVGVDGDLVVEASERLVQLSNGCVCCTVRGDLQAALVELLAARKRRLFGRRDFDAVLIEASGLAAPGPIAQTLALDESLRRALRLDGVVTLVHAVNLPRQLEEFPEAALQLAWADRVLLNHIDRASEAELARAREAIAELAPSARVLEASFAAAPLEELLEVHTTRDAAWDLADSRSAHSHRSGVSTVALESSEPLELDTLKVWLQFLAARRGQELYRVKGILRCAGRPERVVVQAMYEWLELGPGEGPAPERSVLVLIGRDLDREELERGWQACGGRA
jgi:G3E family GTPase